MDLNFSQMAPEAGHLAPDTKAWQWANLSKHVLIIIGCLNFNLSADWSVFDSFLLELFHFRALFIS